MENGQVNVWIQTYIKNSQCLKQTVIPQRYPHHLSDLYDMFPINLLRKGNGNFKLIKSLDQVKYTQNILRGKFLYNLGKIKKKYSE